MAVLEDQKKQFEALVLMHVPFVFRVETRPNKEAYSDLTSKKKYTYLELNRQINKLSHALKNEGVGHGDVVMSCLMNSVDGVILNYASWKIGAIYSPINFRFAPGDIAYCLKDSEPRVFVYDGEIAGTAGQGIEMSEFKVRKAMSASGLEEYASGHPDVEPPAPEGMSPFEEGLRLYTSGTTGRPKGVPHSHADMYIAGLTHSLYGMHWTPSDNILVIAPYFHAAGNIPSYMPALSLGMKVVSMKQFDPGKALDAVEEEKLTFLMGPPTAFEAILKTLQEGCRRDTGTWKAAMLMGAPIPTRLYRALRDQLGISVFNGDGNTEVLYCHTLSPWDSVEKWEGGATAKNGTALPGNLIRVVKKYPDRKAEPDELVPRDGETTGEMIVKNLHYPGGYHNLPEKSVQVFRNGWYYTGDSVTWDEDGYNHIVGRTDDMIISGGENIFPEEVEARIMEMGGVEDCIVVGIPDEQWGELVCAYIVRKDPSLTAGDVDLHLKNHRELAKYKRPRKYVFADSLPFTATGKKQRFMIRKMALEDLGTGGSA